jgi:multidrug efflux system membrane fusion protein
MRHQILLLTLLPIAAGCVQAKTRQAAPASATAPFVRVTSVEQYGGETSGTRYSASIVANSQYDLAFKVGGYVRWLAETRGADGRMRPLQGGDHVRQGTGLAQVRTVDYVNPVLQSQSQLDQSRAQRETSESALREARASREQARAQRSAAEADERRARSKRDEAQGQIEAAEANRKLARSKLEEAQAGLQQALAALTAQQATLKQAQLTYDRNTALYNSNSLTKPDYDAAVADHDRAVAGVKQAEERVAELRAQEREAQSQIEAAEANWKQAQSSHAQAQAQIEGAQATIQSATAQLQGSQARVESAGAQVSAATAGIGAARAQLAQNRVPLGDTTLTVPEDALIIKRLIEVGALVKPGDPAFTVAETSRVKAVFGVPDLRLSDLRMGSPVLVTADAEPGRRFRGQVTGISPSADPKSRVFQVEVTIPNPHRELEVGLIVTAAFAGRQVTEQKVVLPMQAIIGRPDSAGGYGVYVVEGEGETSTVRVRPVELGQVYGDRIQITRGVRQDERVVVSGPALLHDGQAVRIEPGGGADTQEQ